jgi:hypothetical protein
MMRQQRVPRAKWKMNQTDRGKRWIERVCGYGHLLADSLSEFTKRHGLPGSGRHAPIQTSSVDDGIRNLSRT